MNPSLEPPRPRYRDPCPYQWHFGLPSCSPPEYRREDDYFVRDGDGCSPTSLKRMPRVKKGRAGQSRGDLYRQNQPADSYQRGELDRNLFPTEPPRERILLKDAPRHRVEAGAVGRPWSWIDTEGTTVEVISLPDSEAEVVDVPHLGPMAESNPEGGGRPLNLVPVTDAELLLLKDFRKFKDRQRKNTYQHADTAPRSHGSRQGSSVSAFYDSVLDRADGSNGTSRPVHRTPSERRNRQLHKPKEPITRNSSSTSRTSLRSLTARMVHLF